MSFLKSTAIFEAGGEMVTALAYAHDETWWVVSFTSGRRGGVGNVRVRRKRYDLEGALARGEEWFSNSAGVGVRGDA